MDGELWHLSGELNPGAYDVRVIELLGERGCGTRPGCVLVPTAAQKPCRGEKKILHLTNSPIPAQ